MINRMTTPTGGWPPSPEHGGYQPQPNPQPYGQYPPQQQYGQYPPQQFPPQQPYPPQQYGLYPNPGAPPRRSQQPLIVVIALVVLAGLGVGAYFAFRGSDDKNSTGSGGCPDLSSLFGQAPGHPTLDLHPGGQAPSGVELPPGKPAQICTGTISTASGVSDVAGGKPGSSALTTLTYPGASVDDEVKRLTAEGWTCSTRIAAGCLSKDSSINVILISQHGALVIGVGGN